MKIVFDAQAIVEKRTGVGRYVLSLLLSMGKMKVDFKFIPFYFNFRRVFKEQRLWESLEKIDPCEVRWLPGFIMHRLWKKSSCFPIDDFTGKADIFHYPNFLMKPAQSGKKILTVHDLAFKRLPDTIMPKNLKDLEIRFRNNLKKSDAVITVSEFSKNEFHYYFPDYKKPVYVTYNGVDDFITSSFDELIIKAVKQKYSLPEKYILHVGTIEPRKNLSFLLKVMSELKNIDKETKLVLVGSNGWLCDEFFKIFEELDLKDNIKFIGYVAGGDLPYIYHLAELFVFPSLYEGFGMPPLEAMGCGTRVLASSIPVLKEILGKSCDFMSLENSPYEWAIKIIDILNDKSNQQGFIEEGKKRADFFTWEETARKTLDVYKDVLGS